MIIKKFFYNGTLVFLKYIHESSMLIIAIDPTIATVIDGLNPVGINAFSDVNKYRILVVG